MNNTFALDLLDLVGLERRRSAVRFILPAIGLFAVGAGVGGALGLLLAPSSGRIMRRDVSSRLDQMRSKLKNTSNAVAHQHA